MVTDRRALQEWQTRQIRTTTPAIADIKKAVSLAEDLETAPPHTDDGDAEYDYLVRTAESIVDSALELTLVLHDSYSEGAGPERSVVEYQLLLSTGGPQLKVIVPVDRPRDLLIELLGWGTKGTITARDRIGLLQYLEDLYNDYLFGEGSL